MRTALVTFFYGKTQPSHLPIQISVHSKGKALGKLKVREFEVFAAFVLLCLWSTARTLRKSYIKIPTDYSKHTFYLSPHTM